MTETTPTPRAYVLGGDLRRARENAGLGLRQLATRLDVSHSVIVRWEKGERVPSTESVSAVAAVLGLPGVDRDRLVQAARYAATEPVNSVSVGADGENDVLTTLMEFERVATAVTDVAPLLVPGLLQTADYARGILGDAPDPTTKVAVRLGRRDIITRPTDPVPYTAYILETVLHGQTDWPGAADQLRLLLKLGELPNVTVRAVPTGQGVTAAHMGPFVLLEFAGAEPVVHLEHLRSGVFLRDQSDVQTYRDARAELERVAMSPTDTAGLIANVIERTETTS